MHFIYYGQFGYFLNKPHTYNGITEDLIACFVCRTVLTLETGALEIRCSDVSSLKTKTFGMLI